MKKQTGERKSIAAFLAVHGFSLVLAVCLIAISVSAYVLFFSPAAGTQEPADPVMQVSYVPVPTASPAPTQTPAVTPEPSPTPAPAATPSPAPTSAPSVSLFVWPVNGAVVTAFSSDELAYDKTMGDWRVHKGMDIEAPLGAKVCAISDGTVKQVYEDDLMGTTVVISHSDGLESLYSNLQAGATVKEGDPVSCGQVIGAVGESALGEWGLVTHLHLETTQDGAPIDPQNLLSQK